MVCGRNWTVSNCLFIWCRCLNTVRCVNNMAPDPLWNVMARDWVQHWEYAGPDATFNLASLKPLVLFSLRHASAYEMRSFLAINYMATFFRCQVEYSASKTSACSWVIQQLIWPLCSPLLMYSQRETTQWMLQVNKQGNYCSRLWIYPLRRRG